MINLNNLMKQAKIEIEKEINREGFIDDSDNTDRFLDDLAIKLPEREILKENNDVEFYYENEDKIKEISEELLEGIEYYMRSNYKREGSVDKTDNYKGCYYKNKEGLENWNSFSE